MRKTISEGSDVMKVKKKIICLILSSLVSVASLPFENTIPFFSIFTNVSAEERTVIPGGKSIGVTLRADGVIVTELTEITDTTGKITSPAKDAGIKVGDIIKSFNNAEITGVEDLISQIENTDKNQAKISLIRNKKNISVLISPKSSKEDGKMKIGAWVKDSASGIGTLTFYDPKTHFFAALGHGITDTDSGKLISIEEGKILDSTIVSVEKSKKGTPGELKGIFSENESPIGSITTNSKFGISGEMTPDFSITGEEVEIALRSEITTGKAQIISNIEGKNTSVFDIEILRVLPQHSNSSKNMIIKITDEKLLEKTGGIVQGMSGSPIIQNGKLIGAVTHVFVNDPTRGYGVFIENMLS